MLPLLHRDLHISHLVTSRISRLNLSLSISADMDVNYLLLLDSYSLHVCGHARLLLDYQILILSMSADMHALHMLGICREHSHFMLLVTGACGHLPCIAKSSITFDKSP